MLHSLLARILSTHVFYSVPFPLMGCYFHGFMWVTLVDLLAYGFWGWKNFLLLSSWTLSSCAAKDQPTHGSDCLSTCGLGEGGDSEGPCSYTEVRLDSIFFLWHLLVVYFCWGSMVAANIIFIAHRKIGLNFLILFSPLQMCVCFQPIQSMMCVHSKVYGSNNILLTSTPGRT